jgi:hypothetical protein
LPLPSDARADEHAEPGVEVKVDTLKAVPLLDGTLMRAAVSTHKQIPTSNDDQEVTTHSPLDNAKHETCAS